MIPLVIVASRRIYCNEATVHQLTLAGNGIACLAGFVINQGITAFINFIMLRLLL